MVYGTDSQWHNPWEGDDCRCYGCINHRAHERDEANADEYIAELKIARGED